MKALAVNFRNNLGSRPATLGPTSKTSVVDADGQSAAPAGDRKSRYSHAECQTPGAPGVQSARHSIPAVIEPERRKMVRQILQLLGVKFCDNGKMTGGDLGDPKAHAHYLSGLTLEQLEARYAQIKRELPADKQREMFAFVKEEYRA